MRWVREVDLQGTSFVGDQRASLKDAALSPRLGEQGTTLTVRLALLGVADELLRRGVRRVELDLVPPVSPALHKREWEVGL